ncbi:MAG: hypothetical protein HKN47_09130 [Pirellulaceae bacterium]|nr:hypothetical protein [Pirellulaceae bacterium]
MNFREDSCAPRMAVARTVDQKQHERSRRSLLMMVTWFFAIGIVALMCTTANGQFDVMKLNPALEEPATKKRMESAAKAYSTTRDLANVKDANIARYYYNVYIPTKITQPDAITEVSPLIDDVRTRMVSAQRSQAPGAKTIMGWLYSGLKPIAQGNYNPAARINAILFISRMDIAPADRAKQTPPVPLPYIPTDFFPIYQDEANVDGVRAAALQAIHRYVMYAAPALKDPLKQNLITEMKKLLASDPPEGRSQDAHAYLQRFAVDILANLRGATDPELGKTLISISTETKKHDLIALHSALRIGRMSADLKGNVDKTDDVLGSWSIRAMRSFQYEIARLNAMTRPSPVPRQPRAADANVGVKTDETKPKPPMAMGMDRNEGMDDMGMMQEMMEGSDDMQMDDMSAMMGDGMMMGGVVTVNPQPPEVLLSRRKLNHVLQQLHTGVSGSGEPGLPKTAGGLLAAVEDADKPAVESWLTQMEEVVTALNDTALDTRETYIEALDAQVAMLRDIAGPAAAAKAATEPIVLPGISAPVATTVVDNEVPEGPVLDKSGAPKFPDNVDELAEPE